MLHNQKELMAFVKIILFLSIHCLVWSEEKIVNQCNLNQCNGVYKLTSDKEIKPRVLISENKIRISTFQKKIDIGMVKRKRMTIYCYNGWSIDKNTGCEELIWEKTPKPQKAREWMLEETCPTGVECQPDGNCWREDANNCFDETENVKVGPDSLKWQGTRWFVFATHTCVSSWMCQNIKANPTLLIETADNVKIETVYYTRENERVLVDNRFYDTGFKSSDGMTHFPIDKPKSPMVSYGKARCYSSDPLNVKCVITSEGELMNKAFNIDKENKAIFRNNFVEVFGQILTVRDNKVENLFQNSDNSVKGSTIIAKTGRATDIETALEIINTLSVVQLQEIYNVVELTESLNKLYSRVLSIVKILSERDSMILGKVMGKTFATKWVNEDLFEKCPCAKVVKDPLSNCFRGLKYSQGSYSKYEEPQGCFSINSSEVKEIFFGSSSKMDDLILKTLPPEVANSDSEAWDDLNRLRQKTLNEDKQSHGVLTKGGVLGLIDDYFSFSKYLNGFLITSSVVTWILLIILLCRR